MVSISKLSDLLMAGDRHNNNYHQEMHSLARFNANCNRRLAFRETLETPQRQLHDSTEFGAFTAERVLGCPTLFWPERTNIDGA